MEVLDVVAVVGGLGVVAYAFLDAFDTLLATNIKAIRWSLSGGYYRVAWKVHRAACRRVRSDRRRERALSLFGPASFLGLLFLWTSLSIIGWGLVWWGVGDSFSSPPAGLGDSLYYSGVVYFSIGFGDLLPGSGATKVLSILEALDGLGTLGLVIGYLPSLSAAYQSRERQLLLLDDLTDTRMTPVSLVASRLGPDGDTSELDAMFREWEVWCADVFESHSSFPMLVLWRSKHRGHSWVTALGVVTDAAIEYMAAFPGGERGPALRLYRQSVRLITFLAARSGVAAPDYARPAPQGWQLAYRAFSGLGYELRPFDESFERMQDLRAPFTPLMEAFIDELLAPRGFWGVTAADHLAPTDVDELLSMEPGAPPAGWSTSASAVSDSVADQIEEVESRAEPEDLGPD